MVRLLGIEPGLRSTGWGLIDLDGNRLIHDAEAGIATAASFTCRTEAEADAALDAFGPPYVIKDDALAAGKGVLVTDPAHLLS